MRQVIFNVSSSQWSRCWWLAESVKALSFLSRALLLWEAINYCRSPWKYAHPSSAIVIAKEKSTGKSVQFMIWVLSHNTSAQRNVT